jgi:DNA-directed RNA polymerase specialized sigma24 family protein
MSHRNSTAETQELLLESIDGLYRYALILTRNHAEAEDLVQEAYLRAIQAMRKLRPDSNLKGFTILMGVLRGLKAQRASRYLQPALVYRAFGHLGIA